MKWPACLEFPAPFKLHGIWNSNWLKSYSGMPYVKIIMTLSILAKWKRRKFDKKKHEVNFIIVYCLLFHETCTKMMKSWYYFIELFFTNLWINENTMKEFLYCKYEDFKTKLKNSLSIDLVNWYWMIASGWFHGFLQKWQWQ